MILNKKEWTDRDYDYAEYRDEDGVLQGKVCLYYRGTTQLAALSTVVNGIYTGIFKEWDKQGRLTRTGCRKNDLPIGEYMAFGRCADGKPDMFAHCFYYYDRTTLKTHELDQRYLTREEKLIINLKCGTGPWLPDEK